jgi:hypothetical protein
MVGRRTLNQAIEGLVGERPADTLTNRAVLLDGLFVLQRLAVSKTARLPHVEPAQPPMDRAYLPVALGLITGDRGQRTDKRHLLLMQIQQALRFVL